MNKIALLNQDTIDKIAAGEVIERPGSVVKELVENAIDAKATAITVEIKEGGISFIRITDNGYGIEHEEVPLAFLRHSTSKIRSAEDLLSVSSLGFRGEALSSIAAVARVELITKTADALTGTRYLIEGSAEIANEEIGAPEGTTFLVKDLFYNIPARRKFLKTAQTEGTYVTDLIEKLAVSHPDISFKYICNNQTKLHTSGNGSRKDVIYHIYGRDITAALLSVDYECSYFSVSGFIGKPSVSRGNRNYENYYINGRYIKSTLISRAIEEAYKSFMMQHQYPFTVLYFTFPSEILDVNVHPSKMELRFGNPQDIYDSLRTAVYDVLSHKELISEVPVTETRKKEQVQPVVRQQVPEPFEKRRIKEINEIHGFQNESVRHESVYGMDKKTERMPAPTVYEPKEGPASSVSEQITLADTSPAFLTPEAKKKHHIIGQLFKTYWLVEYEDKLYMIDQHAAHEKVLFEQNMKRFKNREITSQTISPPVVISLDANEEEMLKEHLSSIQEFGYEIEHFGGREYMICAVPDYLGNIDIKDLFTEMLDDFSNLGGRTTPELVYDRLATMSCKAAVKGNDALGIKEADALVEELLSLENPFNCPHGRPTIIAMSKYEIEKKFKRIIS